jgi:hypothetical protein
MHERNLWLGTLACYLLGSKLRRLVGAHGGIAIRAATFILNRTGPPIIQRTPHFGTSIGEKCAIRFQCQISRALGQRSETSPNRRKQVSSLFRRKLNT